MNPYELVFIILLILLTLSALAALIVRAVWGHEEPLDPNLYGHRVPLAYWEWDLYTCSDPDRDALNGYADYVRTYHRKVKP